MRKICDDMGSVKNTVRSLMGQSLEILLNPGRNKISTHSGTVGAIYPSLFTLNLADADEGKQLVFSYSDVRCGKVRLRLRGN